MLRWKRWPSCFDRMQSKLFRTSISIDWSMSAAVLCFNCVCMRLLTENMILHHASWFQSLLILQITNRLVHLTGHRTHWLKVIYVVAFCSAEDCGFSFCPFSFTFLCFPFSTHLFFSFFTYIVSVSGWWFPSSRTQLPAAHQWCSSGRAGARIREEPLRNWECAWLRFPLSYFTS